MTENTEDSPQPFIKLKNNKLNFTEKTFTNSEAAFYLFKSTCNKATTVWRSPGTMFHHSIKKGILYVIVLTCPTKLEPKKQLAIPRI